MPHRKLSIKKGLIDAVEKYMVENPDSGYRSLAEFVEDAIKRRSEELGIVSDEFKNLIHINTYEDHVTIADKNTSKLINVYFDDGGKPFCDLDEKSNCVHVKYALKLPEVRKAFRLKGLNIPKIEGS